MYIPSFYAITEPSESLAIAAERRFGVVIAADGGVPEAAHVPFVLDTAASDRPCLRFHLARGNGLLGPIAAGARLLMVVSGPDCYVSPDWYRAEDQVPTWNYVAVHLGGHGRILDAGELSDQVDALSAMNEARLAPKRPWTSAKMTPRRREGMLRAIVGVEMTVETVEGKRKLSQNKSTADRAGVVDALRARGEAGGVAVADLMAEAAEAVETA
jgi:transcriptional regulator